MNRFFVRWLRPPKCGEAADDRRLHQDKLFQNTALHTCRSVLHLLFVSRFFLLFFSTAICFPSFFFRHRRSKRHTRHTANEIFPLAHVLASAIDNKRRESYDGGGGDVARWRIERENEWWDLVLFSFFFKIKRHKDAWEEICVDRR